VEEEKERENRERGDGNTHLIPLPLTNVQRVTSPERDKKVLLLTTPHLSPPPSLFP
jgi:hypothetical protein